MHIHNFKRNRIRAASTACSSLAGDLLMAVLGCNYSEEFPDLWCIGVLLSVVVSGKSKVINSDFFVFALEGLDLFVI